MPDDLDVRIRELVARAVADAPAAPELDPAVVPIEPAPSRRGWWIGGGAALLAAAALVATFVLVGLSDDTVTTPATNPSTNPTTTVPAPTTSAPVVVPPTAAAPAAPAGQTWIATAGPAGVVLRDAAGTTVRTLDEPMAIALPLADGRVIVQRVSDPSEDGDHTPLVWELDGSLGELLPGIEWSGPVTLHDVALVDGVTTLLYSLTTDQDIPDQAREELTAVTLDGPDSGRFTDIAVIGGWESGTSRLHLSSNGLIVGQRSAEVSSGPLFLTVPGSSAERTVPDISPAWFDLQEWYPDCAESCPRLFTASPDGTAVWWLDGEALTSQDVATGAGAPEYFGTGVPVAPVFGDVDVFEDGVLLSTSSFDGEPPPPVLVIGDTITTLEGRIATHGPAGAIRSTTTVPPTTVATTIPATTVPPTTAPPATPPQRVLTAGPDGVIAVTDGVALTLTTDSMVIALDAGDGRVIVQRQAGQPQGRPWTEADTVPLELAPDGNLLTLFGGADWDGATVLHDIEVVGGRRLLLYSSQSELVPQESNEDLYVADLDTGERTLVANGIGGWEFGTSRLHLATTGLIVGQHNFSPSWAPLFLAVPFSPADGNLPSPSDVGLEDNYPDCAECPSAFTVSPDGLRLLWRSGLEPLVVGTSLADPTEPEPLVSFPDGVVESVDANEMTVIINYFDQPPVLVSQDGSDPTTLPGQTATFPPAG